MIEAVLLVFDASGTWGRIVRAERRLMSILLKSLLPLLVVTCAIEGYGLVHWGKHHGMMTRPRIYSLNEAVVFESGQVLTSVLVVFAAAALLYSMAGTFHLRHTYSQAFTVIAYSLGPFFLLRALDAFSFIPPWLSWAIGILLVLAALYHGVPQVLQPDPPQTFGLYLMTAVVMIGMTGVMGFIVTWYLEGRFAKLDALIARLGHWLPF